jgi:hypothetical protein
LARVGTSGKRSSLGQPASARRNDPTASEPWYWSSNGGIRNHVRSVSIATMPSMSSASHASANRCTISRSRAECGGGARCFGGKASGAAMNASSIVSLAS